MDDFEDDIIVLIAMHCRLEDYRLAYLINKHFGIKLERKASDLDYNNGQVRLIQFMNGKNETMIPLESWCQIFVKKKKSSITE